MKTICFLEIQKFYCGNHYYGHIVSYNGYQDKIELKRVVTEEDTKEKDYEDYVVGGETSRFTSYMELVNLAKSTYKEHFPECNTLIEGSIGTLDPQHILDGPEKFMDDGNKLWRKYESLNWDDDKEEVEKIYSKWDDLIKKHCIKVK